MIALQKLAQKGRGVERALCATNKEKPFLNWQLMVESLLWLSALSFLASAAHQFARYELFQHFPQLFAASQPISRSVVSTKTALPSANPQLPAP